MPAKHGDFGDSPFRRIGSRLMGNKHISEYGSSPAQPSYNILIYFFITEVWLSSCRNFPWPLRPIVTFWVLASFRNCRGWSIFPTIPSHGLVAVEIGISPHEAMEI